VRSDADNIAIAIMAKSLGVKNIIALLRKPEYEPAYRSTGVTTLISITDLLLHQLMMEIEQPKVKMVMPLGGGKAEIYAVEIPPGARSIGMTVREIAQQKKFPKECVFVGIYHKESDSFCIPRGDHDLKEWDTVFLVSNSLYIKPALICQARIFHEFTPWRDWDHGYARCWLPACPERSRRAARWLGIGFA